MRLRIAVVVTLGVIALVVGATVGKDDEGDPRGARVIRYELSSRYVGRKLDQVLVVPRGGGRGRPLVVFLHGRGSSPGDQLSDEFYAALDALGPRAPVVLLPSGGDDSYWHNREDGEWMQYVVGEAITRGLVRSGADRRRLAISGISMGGFGAFDIARVHSGLFCAVAGHSPAVWTRAEDTAEGAFDDAADFRRHDVVASGARGLPAHVWVDVGDDDPFREGVAALVAAIRSGGGKPSVHVWEGGHDSNYWRAHMRDYFRFYARALERCQS